MSLSRIVRRAATAFRQSEAGATAVEFSIVLPVMLVCFAAIVEGSRIYWNYQGTVTGVRDAVRYVARTTDRGICGTSSSTLPQNIGGNSVANATTRINRNTQEEKSSGNLFPTAVTVGSVTAQYTCGGNIPVARVTATVTVQLPFGNLFRFFSDSEPEMESTITDQ